MDYHSARGHLVKRIDTIKILHIIFRIHRASTSGLEALSLLPSCSVSSSVSTTLKHGNVDAQGEELDHIRADLASI